MNIEIKIARLEKKMDILHEELRILRLTRDFPEQYMEQYLEEAQPVVNRGAKLN